jgi:alanyl-tRNA synthetase
MEQSIDRLASLTGVDRDKLEPGLSAKMKELGMYKYSYEFMEDELSRYMAKELAGSGELEIVRELDYERGMLRKIATKFAEAKKDGVILVYNKRFEAVSIAGAASKEGAVEFVKRQAKKLGMQFKGGGSDRIAEGKFAPQ